MHRSLTITAIGCVALLSCDPQPQVTRPDKTAHITEATLFTDKYSRSRLAPWHLHAVAAGKDCDVLIVKTSIILDESMVDAMHYGAGAYAVYDGGVQRFSRDRAFRGVAYADSGGRVWTYGNLSAAEATTLKPCD